MFSIEERLMQYDQQGLFGDYHLDGTEREAFLGSGSFGSVYRLSKVEIIAAHEDRYTRAVKLIAIDAEHIRRSRSVREEDIPRQLIREKNKVDNEIRTMKKLGQETGIAFFFESRVIQRTDTPETSWDVLIIMEELEVLPKYLQNSGCLPGTTACLKCALHVWMEISSALQVCEIKQILHLDIKPDNIFRSAGNHYKLGDFGNAMEGASFDEKILRGTLDYMAPEMYYRQGGDICADIYSLAVTVYEMLNGGRLPFQQPASGKRQGATVRELRTAAYEMRLKELRPVQPIRGVPQDINELLLRCLQKDPGKRCADCSELSKQTMALYVKYCAGAPRRKTGRRVLLGAAAAVSVLGLGAAVLALRSEKPREIALESAAPAWTEEPTPTAVRLTPSPVAADTPSPRPTPAPTPVPKMTLEMEKDSVSSDGSALEIEGRVYVTGTVDAEKLEVSVNGNGVAAHWRTVEGGYAFTAHITNMDLTDVDQVQVRVRLRDEAEVAPVEASLPVHAAAVQGAPAEESSVQAPIQADENAETYFLGEGSTLTLTGSAQPYSTIQVQINGRIAGNYAAGEDGRFAVDVTAGMLQANQENQVTAAYRDSDSAVEWRIYYDTVPPVLECAAQIDQNTDALDVQVTGAEGDAPVSLWVDGVSTGISATPDETGVAHLAGLQSLQLTDESNLELRMADRAGNVGRAQLSFVRTMAEIRLSDRLVHGQVTGQAEPGAQVSVQMGQESRTVDVAPDGSFAAEFGDGFADGAFEATAAYTAYQGTPVIETRQITQTLQADSQPPQVQVQPEILVNDMRQITVSVGNEPQGWQAVLFLNGEVVAQADGQNGEETTLTLPEDRTLDAGSDLQLAVRDGFDNLSTVQLSYREVAELTAAASYDAASDSGDTLLHLHFSGEPGARVDYALNGQADVLSLDDSGAADVELPNVLQEGENLLTFCYGAENGWPQEATAALAREMSISADTQAPLLTAEPQRITPLTQTINVQLEGETEECTLEMWVNGICMLQTTAGKETVLEGVKQLHLKKGDEILLRATDSAGNVATLPLEYYAIDPLQAQPSKNGFELLGEPGAQVRICVNDTERQVTLSEQGSGEFDTTGVLQEGENRVTFEYAPENGFDPALVPEAPVEQTLWNDSLPPEITLSAERITRDTGEITITVTGEDSSCTAILSVNGEAVLRAGGTQTITLRGLNSLGLKEGDDLRLSVTDGFGNETSRSLTYENTSTRAQAWARTATEFLGSVSAGGHLEVSIPLLCHRYDMTEGYVTLYLMDAAANYSRITFDTLEMSPDQYGQCMALQGDSIDATYVDTGYFLTGLTAREHMPGGNYVLVLQVETEYDRWTFPLGIVEVEQSQQDVGNYVDLGSQYAVGFDELLQPEFLPDQVLLSGWVCRQPGKEAYFDSYELKDINGNSILQGIFDNEEFAQYERMGVDAKAPGISGSVSSGAGFVLTPHWGSLPDGEYILQIRSSDTLGTAIPTASVCFRISASAAPLAPDAAATLTAGWVASIQLTAPQ